MSQGRLPNLSEEDYIHLTDRSTGLPIAPPGFEMIRRLGGGAMGDVYLVFDCAAERQVALKFLRTTGPAAVDRFLVEVRALARIEHTNIVKILSTNFQCPVPFFTMEFAAGGTLSGLVAARGPLPVNEAAQLLAVVARAIDAAHSASVLHRDLKPSNILLGADGTPKVADFGLAKRTDQDDGLTIVSGPLGTASFMPPEQVSRRHGTVGPSSDVYSLGATLYCLLTGQPPFMGESSHEIAGKVISEQPERIRTHRAEVPAGLEAIVLKCLEKKQKDRYPTAAALAADLDRFLAGEAQLAPPLTPWRRLQKWVGRHHRLALCIGATLLLALGFLWLKPLRKIDPLETIHQEISAGNAVKLIAANGQPRWNDWPIAPAELIASPDAGGTCSFSSRELKVLLLLDDPGVDHYRISAEICERQKSNPNSSYDTVGLVLGFATQAGPANGKVYNMELFGFSEFDQQGKAPSKRSLQLRHWAVVEENPVTPRSILPKRGVFTPLDPVLPGPPWRNIQIDVSPNGLTTREPKQMPQYPAAEIARRRVELAAVVANSKVKLANLPEWSPRLPIGIWCLDAEVAFRNVTIEALK